MARIALTVGVIAVIQLLSYGVTADPISIPVTRRSSSVVHDINYYAAAADRVRARYGFPTSNSARNIRANNSAKFGKRASSAGISITDQDDDSSYFASITIGTPGQAMNVVLDTGSSDLWVASSDCERCSKIPEFDSSKSSTFQTSSSSTGVGKNGGQSGEVTIQYGSGEVAGTLAQDTVTMGGFTVKSQTFLLVSKLTENLVDAPVSGIMGLAFQSIASTESTPFWQQLVDAGDLSSPEMGVWLQRQGTGSATTSSQQNTEAPGGVFTLGGTNSSLFSGDIEFLNTTGTPSYWLLNVNELTVQSSSVSLASSSQLAAIDTGTTLLGGPTDVVQNFYSFIQGSGPVQGQQGFFSFPCDTTLNTTISFGGTAWSISSEDMNLGPLESGSSDCLGGIFDLGLGSDVAQDPLSPTWVVGDVFLKNVYTVFRGSSSSSDTPAVGFAKLSSAAGGSGSASSSSAQSSAAPASTTTNTVSSSPTSESGTSPSRSESASSTLIPVSSSTSTSTTAGTAAGSSGSSNGTSSGGASTSSGSSRLNAGASGSLLGILAAVTIMAGSQWVLF